MPTDDLPIRRAVPKPAVAGESEERQLTAIGIVDDAVLLTRLGMDVDRSGRRPFKLGTIGPLKDKGRPRRLAVAVTHADYLNQRQRLASKPLHGRLNRMEILQPNFPNASHLRRIKLA